MWIKKINEYFENMSEYDNNDLVLHVSVDFIDMLKERVSFELDDDSNMAIKILKYDGKEEYEVDEEGFMYWVQMKFHRELISVILSLKQKFDELENKLKGLTNSLKQTSNEEKVSEINDDIEKGSKELQALEMIMGKVNGYRTNIFNNLKDKEDIDKILSNIRIYKEHCD